MAVGVLADVDPCAVVVVVGAMVIAHTIPCVLMQPQLMTTMKMMRRVLARRLALLPHLMFVVLMRKKSP